MQNLKKCGEQREAAVHKRASNTKPKNETCVQCVQTQQSSSAQTRKQHKTTHIIKDKNREGADNRKIKRTGAGG